MFEIHFDSTATRSYTALILRRFVQGPLALAIGILILLPFVLTELETHNVRPLFFAAALLAFTVYILRSFINDKLENDNQPPLSKRNAACLLSVSVLRRLRKNPENEYELLEGATLSRRGKFILEEMGLERDRLLELAKPVTEQNPILPLFEELLPVMHEFGEQKIHAGIILYAFFSRKEVFGELLNALDLSLEDVRMIVKWEQFHHIVWKKASPWSPERLVHTFGGVGRTWVMGYNDELDRLTTDISQRVLYKTQPQVVLHSNQIDEGLHILNKQSSANMLLIGKEGVGKGDFIQHMTYRMRREELEEGRQYTRVLLLNAEELLSATADPDAFFLSAIKRADKTGAYILVIKNIGLFLQAGDTALRGVLGRVLEAKNIHVIGVVDTKDYHALIKTDAALDAQFEKITLEDPEAHLTMGAIMETYFKLSDTEHVRVTYKALKAIYELTERYIAKGGFPGKAIAILQDAIQVAHEEKIESITEDHIRRIISTKSHVNVEKVRGEEKDVLLELEEQLASHIVGQKHALHAITSALKRARLQIKDHHRPIGTFLFLGPTGVGKTETAKALAEIYFGSSDNMIRIDMNEYSSGDSVSGIIGSSDPRMQTEGFLSKRIQDTPHSLILLDEIEKAHQSVLNVFLQVLDEGQLIDALGNKVDFRNTIIIATSNAGSVFIRDMIRSNPRIDTVEFKKQLLDTSIEQKMYSPEFLNRFDDTVLYLPLTKEETIRIAVMMIDDIVQELEEKQGITITIEEDAVRFIAEKGYNPEFGAREMRRAVTDYLENHIADRLLKADVKRGDNIAVTRNDIAN